MFDYSTPWSIVLPEINRLGAVHGHVTEGCSALVRFEEYMIAAGASTLGGMISVGLDTNSTLLAVGLAQLVSRKYIRDLFTRAVCLDFMRIAATDCAGGWLISYCVNNIPEEIETLLAVLPAHVRASMDADPFWNSSPDYF